MKKHMVIAMALACVCLVALVGCKKTYTPVEDDNKTNIEENKPVEDEKEEEDVVTIDDVKEYFKVNESFGSCEITDCVLTPDNAQGLIGVVQYTDEEGNTACFAFVRSDGTAYPSRIEAEITDDSVLTYLGNGTIAFTLTDDKNEVYDYTLSYSYDEKENNTHFEVHSNIRK